MWFSVYSDADVTKFGVDGGNWIYPVPEVDYTSGTTLISGKLVVPTSTSLNTKLLPRFRGTYAVGNTLRINYFIFTNLNVYFNTSDLSFLGATDSAKLATIQQKYPWLLEPSDYGTGIVDSSYSGVRAWARNLFNGIWEDGYLNPSNGSVVYSSGYKTTDYIPIKPLTEFYIMGTQTSTDSVNVAYYGQNKEFLYHEASVLTGLNRTFTTQSGVYYMRITITNASTKTEGFMLNQSDSQNGTYTPYHEPDTLTLPDPVTLRSAGSVQDTDELNVEVDIEVDGVQKKVKRRRQTKRVSPYTFDGSTDVINFSENWRTNCYSFRISIAKTIDLDPVVTVRTICSQYIYSNSPSTDVGTFSLYKDADGLVIYINHDNNSMGMTAFKALLQSSPIEFNFVRVTPVVTLLDPIEDNYIKVEPNGTIEPVQSQSPEVDSAMTVEYMAS